MLFSDGTPWNLQQDVRLGFPNKYSVNLIRPIKNTCVSGSPTDPINSGPDFSPKKSDFSYHKFARKLTKNG